MAGWLLLTVVTVLASVQVTVSDGDIPGNFTTNSRPLIEEDFKRGEDLENGKTDAEKLESYLRAFKNVAEAPEEPGKARFALRDVHRRWPNGVVPYILDTAFNDEFRGLIASAITAVKENSCVVFRPKEDGDLDWVNIFSVGAKGCFGTLGYYGPGHGEHKLSLEGPDSCNDKGVIIHEMFHNLGFGHEHSRPDRDSYLTVNWPNLDLGKANNHFRHQWDSERDDGTPECKTEGVDQASADFSNCVSGSVVEDFGVGYDKDSIMHYGITFFAVDKSNPVLVPKDSSITKMGGSELTEKDIAKLQKAYGCDSCGGYFRSDAGGAISGSAGDAKSPCESILEASPGKGIKITITSISGEDDCTNNHLEVRLGGKKDSQLVGKYCSKDSPIKIRNPKVWVKWVRSKPDEGKLEASWSTFSISCCPNVMLEKLDGQKSSQGIYIQQEKLVNGRNYYFKDDEDEKKKNWLFFAFSGWSVVDVDPNTFEKNSVSGVSVKNKAWEYCPTEVTKKWTYYDGEDREDEDAQLRCTDCKKYPAQPECAVCCDELNLKSTYHEFTDTSQYYSQFVSGSFKAQAEDFNGHKIYQHSTKDDFCIYFSNLGSWTFYKCSGKDGNSNYWSAGASKCLRQSKPWTVFSQSKGASEVTDLTFECAGGAPTIPTPVTDPPTTEDAGGPGPGPSTDCLPCKSITSGPTELQGKYELDKANTQPALKECKDQCVYKKGDVSYCFSSGGYPVDTC